MTDRHAIPALDLGVMSRYLAHISQKRPIRYDTVPGSVGVLEAPDKPMPIGEASCRTWDENVLAVWTLRIGKQEIPGRWVIIDREFRPAQ
jgi:hypothetical protein